MEKKEFWLMTKKGEIREWLSRIQYGIKNSQDFSVIFRDFNEYIELSFVEFMERRQIDTIPLHRISQFRERGIPVFTRPNFFLNCGHPLEEKVCQNFRSSEKEDNRF